MQSVDDKHLHCMRLEPTTPGLGAKDPDHWATVTHDAAIRKDLLASANTHSPPNLYLPPVFTRTPQPSILSRGLLVYKVSLFAHTLPGPAHSQSQTSSCQSHLLGPSCACRHPPSQNLHGGSTGDVWTVLQTSARVCIIQPVTVQSIYACNNLNESS